MFTLRLTLAVSLVALVVSKCQNRLPEDVGLTDDDRRAILDFHNELRNTVAKGDEPTQPPAQNMREMTWDNELEITAQEWADNCQFEHDPRLQNKLKGTGQNMFMKYATWKEGVTKLDFKNYIQPWYNEVKEFGYNGTFDHRSGHYSQVIWGATNKVGCGYSITQKPDSYYLYFVCNYSPGGNVIGKLPYKYGPIDCEENEMFRSSYYSNLCDINKLMLLACSARDSAELSNSTANNII